MSVEYFLREGGLDVGSVGAERFVVVAVHSVILDSVHAEMLDSGFVGFDPISGKIFESSALPLSKVSSKLVCYTLPELLNDDMTEFVVLECQSLGNFVNVYGCLWNIDSDSVTRRLCLNGGIFADPIVNKKDNKRMFDEMRNMVKEGLVLPLMTDLRQWVWDCKRKQNKKRKRRITEKDLLPHRIHDSIRSDVSDSGSDCSCGGCPDTTDSGSLSSSSPSSGCSPDTTDKPPFITFL